MNDIEAFKNELRNYHYYKNLYKKYSNIYDEEIKLPNEDAQKFKLLKAFYPKLVDEEAKLDGIFTQLTGFHAIRYDKEPSIMSEELSMEIKLDLIDKYEAQLTKYIVAIEYAEATLISEMNRLSNSINYIENILKQLPKDIAKVCVDVYCYGKKYEYIASCSGMYWTASGLFRYVERELARVLNCQCID